MTKYIMLPQAKMALKYDDTVTEVELSESANSLVLFTLRNIGGGLVNCQYYQGGFLKWEHTPTAGEITDQVGLLVIDVTEAP